MKVIVFGATGSVGRRVVAQALERGHHVTAFARDPSRIGVRHSSLAAAQGDATDPVTVAKAITGHDAVLVSIGSGRKGGVRAATARVIVNAMEEVGVRRLVCLSSIGVGDSRAHLNFFWRRVMFGLVLRSVYADHVEQEEIVKAGDLDWTIVRSGSFTDGPLIGRYRHGFGPQASAELKISREDVAHFMLDQLTDVTYLRRTPSLSY